MIYGQHKVSTTANITELSIGGFLCSTYNITQNYYYGFSECPIRCLIDPNQPAGFYNITELTTYGYAKIRD